MAALPPISYLIPGTPGYSSRHTRNNVCGRDRDLTTQPFFLGGGAAAGMGGRIARAAGRTGGGRVARQDPHAQSDGRGCGGGSPARAGCIHNRFFYRQRCPSYSS